MTTPRPTVQELVDWLRTFGKAYDRLGVGPNFTFAADALLGSGLPLDAPFYPETGMKEGPVVERLRRERDIMVELHRELIDLAGMSRDTSETWMEWLQLTKEAGEQMFALAGTKSILLDALADHAAEPTPTPASTAGAGEELLGLIPCPFCGAKEGDHNKPWPWQDEERSLDRTWNIYCWNCQAEGPYAATEAEAIAAWNRRVSPASETIARVKAASDWFLNWEHAIHTRFRGHDIPSARFYEEMGVAFDNLRAAQALADLAGEG